MSRADEVDAELEALYAQVPDVGCQQKPGCLNSCGPVDGGLRERIRLARAGVKLPPKRVSDALLRLRGHYTCPALVGEQCTVYEVRPMICRLWGAWEPLPCPYGCRPAGGKLLSAAEGLALLDAAQCAGGIEQPRTVAEFEQLLNTSGFGDWFRRMAAANRPKIENRKTGQ